MITPGLLTNLCRIEMADSISVPEAEAASGLWLRGKVEAEYGGQLCVPSYLMELFY